MYNEQDFQSELREHLNKDERLLWTGKPRDGVVFRGSDIFAIPFSLMWGGFAIFWVVMVAISASVFFAIFGIPFVVIGLYFIFGRFWVDAKQRENTIYGITENRIIIKSGIFTKEIKSLNIRTLSDISVREKVGGMGTISLGPPTSYGMWGSGMMWWPGVPKQPCLEFITNVKQVYILIVEQQNRK